MECVYNVLVAFECVEWAFHHEIFAAGGGSLSTSSQSIVPGEQSNIVYIPERIMYTACIQQGPTADHYACSYRSKCQRSPYSSQIGAQLRFHTGFSNNYYNY